MENKYTLNENFDTFINFENFISQWILLQKATFKHGLCF